MRISGNEFLLKSTIFSHLLILGAFIINQPQLVLCLSFVGKRDLLSNNEVDNSCMKDTCPVSAHKPVSGRFYD